MTVGLEPRGGTGPYTQGATALFDTRFTNNTSNLMVMRLFQFADQGSEVPMIAISTDTVPSYRFSSPITNANSWQINRPWPNPAAAWSQTYYDNDPDSEFYNGNMAVAILPGGNFLNKGTGTGAGTGAFGVIVPTFDPGCDPEVFWSPTLESGWCDWAKVDIVTGTGNPDFSGRLRANFDEPSYDMTLANGGLQGGMGYFYVLPEPASLGLLGLGMLVVLRRRR
jgi:hypothetical protein